MKTARKEGLFLKEGREKASEKVVKKTWENGLENGMENPMGKRHQLRTLHVAKCQQYRSLGFASKCGRRPACQSRSRVRSIPDWGTYGA